MKKAVLWMLLTACLMVLAGCGAKSSVAGKYINPKNPEEYLVLKPDGYFSLRTIYVGLQGKMPMGDEGTYEVKGDIIAFKPLPGLPDDYDFHEITREADIKDNTITDKKGRAWVKQ